MQITAPQLNFTTLVAPQATNVTKPQATTTFTPQINAEASTAQNANSFARMLQNRQQGAAMQAAVAERRAAADPIKAPPQQTPAQPATSRDAQKTATTEKQRDPRTDKTPDRTATAKLPQRSDGPRTPSAQAPEPSETSEVFEPADPSIKVDPKDGPVIGMSEWWVPVAPSTVMPTTTPTLPAPVDDNAGGDAAAEALLSDVIAKMPVRVDGKPMHPGIKSGTDMPLPSPSASAASAASVAKAASATEAAATDAPICLAPETDGAAAAALPVAAADAAKTVAPDAASLPAGLIASTNTTPAPTRTPVAALRADREEAAIRVDGTRNAATPLTGNALESLPRGSAEAVRVIPAAAQGDGRSFAETLSAAAPVGLPTARSEAGPAAPVSVSIATPATAPEFREALGVQVSLLVKDGVQTAELHLNPTDMGPISVQITTDGTQAQVDFGADSATTRQIIEQGLPELAGALRDAGITLTGGGVSQHARGQSDDGQPGQSADGRRSTRRVTVDGIEGAASAPATRSVQTSRGQVDLYA